MCVHEKYTKFYCTTKGYSTDDTKKGGYLMVKCGNKCKFRHKCIANGLSCIINKHLINTL